LGSKKGNETSNSKHMCRLQLLSQLSFCSDISKETSNLQEHKTPQVVAVFLPSFIVTYRELTTMEQVNG